MGAYDQLLSAADGLNLPLAYKNDLLVHDRESLEKFSPQAFAWSIRRTGTHLIIPTCEMDCEWGLACSQTDKDTAHYFLFDKGRLRSCSRFEWDCWIRTQRSQMAEHSFSVKWSGDWIRPYFTTYTIKATYRDVAREILDQRLLVSNTQHKPEVQGELAHA